MVGGPLHFLRMGALAVCAFLSLEHPPTSAPRFRWATRTAGTELMGFMGGYDRVTSVLTVGARAGGGWSAGAATWWSCWLAGAPCSLALAGTTVLAVPSEGNLPSAAMIW